MPDDEVGPERSGQRPSDPAGLRPYRLRWLTQPWRLALPGGADVVVRGARQADTDALALMHGRCSMETLHARYRAPRTRLPRSSLRRLVSSELALVAVSGHARVVALANLTPVDPETAEVAVLVEDAFQHRGVGTALVRQIAAGARLVGYRRLQAQPPPYEQWQGRFVRDLGLTSARSDDAGLLHAEVGPSALSILVPPGARVSAGREQHAAG